MSVIGFLILAVLAAFFVFAPKLGIGRVKNVNAEVAQKELLLERLDEIEIDSSDQQSELATDIAADLSQARQSTTQSNSGTSSKWLIALAILIPVFFLGSTTR